MTVLAAPGRWMSKASISFRDPLMVVVTVICGLLVLLAILGPYLAPYPPDQTDILAANEGPSAEHLLGTDALGRDVLSRLLVAARLSFAAAFTIIFVATTLGTLLALASAWHGGWLDNLISKSMNVLFAIPGVLVALLAVAVFGAGYWAPVIALSLVYIPYLARVIRASAVQERARPYVEAAELAGISVWRINVFHILRNLVPIVIAQATFGFASAMMDFGAISFLGLGVQPPASEWGLMVAEGRSEVLQGSYQVSLSAGFMIVLTVVAFNMLGERITHRLGDVR